PRGVRPKRLPCQRSCPFCTSRSRAPPFRPSPSNAFLGVCTRLSAARTINRQHLQLHACARTRASRRSFGYSAASTRVSELTCASAIFWLQLRWLSLGPCHRLRIRPFRLGSFLCKSQRPSYGPHLQREQLGWS